MSNIYIKNARGELLKDSNGNYLTLPTYGDVLYDTVLYGKYGEVIQVTTNYDPDAANESLNCPVNAKTLNLLFSMAETDICLLYTGPAAIPIDASNVNEVYKFELGTPLWTFCWDESSLVPAGTPYSKIWKYLPQATFDLFKVEAYSLMDDWQNETGGSIELADYLESLKNSTWHLGTYQFNCAGTGQWAKIA